MSEHPAAPEQRTIDVDVEALDTRGRTLTGYAAVYGVESHDLGGFREKIAPGAFAGVMGADVRALLNHDPSQVLGRTKSGTLRLADEQRGLRFECDIPDSPLGENVREAVKRGDVDGASFRFKVGEEEWEGDTRTVKTVAELHDVTVATYGAYPDASVELRTRPDSNTAPEAEKDTSMDTENRTEGGGLAVEDRAQVAEERTIDERVTSALRSIRKGEARSLTTANTDGLPGPEVGRFIFDKLRASSVALATGIRVIATGRESIVWPRITADVNPTWVAETDVIPEGDPAFGELTATPKKLAHRVELSNEVIDDSEPSIVDVLNQHLATMLGLKLDRGIFEGNPTADPESIRGLKYVTGVQEVSMGTNGDVVDNYDPFIQAVGLLQAANVPGPYAIVANPRTVTGLELLKTETGSAEQLSRPAALPTFYATSQLSTTETKGTSTDTSSAYVFAPSEVVLVRRQDATIELDRSRLFDRDMSELRGKLRADLIVPNPSAVVRITGIKPAA